MVEGGEGGGGEETRRARNVSREKKIKSRRTQGLETVRAA